MLAQKIIKAVTKKQWISLAINVFLITFSLLIIEISQFNVDFTTNFYSFGFYPFYMTILSTMNSLVPFSIAEFLIILAIFSGIFYIFFLIYLIIKHRNRIFNAILVLITTISVVAFLFTISFLPNYHRHTFYEYSGLTMTETSVDNLYALCYELAENANEYRDAIDQNGAVFSYENAVSTTELFEICTNSYENLINDYPEYEDLFSVVSKAIAKPVVLSEIMSYLRITGFFFGLTGEANINTNSSDIYIPATVCHELAHVAGFMREDEANFIAYLVCRSSDNELLNYSGTMLAFLHSGNALYGKDPDKYYEITAMLSDDVILDLQAHSEYYKSYETNVGKVSTTVNDTYLKANKQEDGVDSYGRMVDLLIADYNQRH